ncbi:MAG: hypothetical protein ABJN84_13570 [Flavobacteriaceae bacterium]
MEIEVNPKVEKAIGLYKRLITKSEHHYKKYNRARKSDTIDFHWDSYKLYRDVCRRMSPLIFALKRGGDKFGEGRRWFEESAEEYVERINKRKAAAKEKFDSTYSAHLYFFQNSLYSDYGTYSCESCKITFYHSPSALYLGKEKQHECICGNCVNNFMVRNGQEEVYH